jgi:hypothetical protein
MEGERGRGSRVGEDSRKEIGQEGAKAETVRKTQREEGEEKTKGGCRKERKEEREIGKKERERDGTERKPGAETERERR